MKLIESASKHDYWAYDLDRARGNPRPFKHRRDCKKRLARERRIDAKKYMASEIRFLGGEEEEDRDG